MASFEVESYRVSIGAGSNDSFYPRLFLVSPDLSHGIRVRFNLFFESVPSTYSAENAIGIGANVGAPNYNGSTFWGYMSPSAFDDVYDLVRNESPINVQYFYKQFPNAASTTKLLTSVTIGTMDEVPGEGSPDDGHAAEHMVLSLAGVNGTS